jgi:hypothetical protein
MPIMKAIILILGVPPHRTAVSATLKNGGWIMKKISPWLVLLTILSMSLAGTSYAGPMMRGGGWGMNSRYGRMFNPNTVETVSGKVVKIDEIMPMRGMSRGIHLTLRTGKGDVSVHLGPAWYINKQEPAVQVGDRVDIKGSMVTFHGGPVMIAQEVRMGDRVLRLRDDNGMPMWAGRGMGRGMGR